MVMTTELVIVKGAWSHCPLYQGSPWTPKIFSEALRAMEFKVQAVDSKKNYQ